MPETQEREVKSLPQRVIEEVEAAIKVREKYRKGPERAEKKLPGPYHHGDFEGDGAHSDVENRIHELTATTIPQLAMHNPRVRMGSDRTGVAQEASMALRHATNRWAVETKIKHEAQLFARDGLLGWGVAHVGLEPAPVLEGSGVDDPVRPRFERIAPDDHIMDPWCHHWTKARYHAHKIVVRKDLLLEYAKENPDEGWNVKAIERMAMDTNSEDAFSKDSMDRPERGEVCYWQVWMRYDEDEGALSEEERKFHHGRMYYVALEKDQDPQAREFEEDWVRDPQPFYGPACGPYVVFGVWDAPSTPFPVSPAVAILNGVEYFNRLRLANMSAESDHKQLLIVDDMYEDMPDLVRDGEDGLVIRAQGFDKDKILQVEVGGASQQGYLAEDRMRTWLDRMSGTDPAQAGSANPDATATATVVADAAAETLRSHMKARFGDAMEQALMVVAWYLYTDEGVVQPLGAEAAKDLGMEQPVFYGGPDEGLSFDELELRMEVMSMEQTSAGLHQSRVERFFTWLVQFAPALVQFPFIKAADVIRQYAESLNLWDMDDLVDMDVLNLMQAALAEGAAAQSEAEAQGQGGQPQGAQQQTASQNATNLAGAGAGGSPTPSLQLTA